MDLVADSFTLVCQWCKADFGTFQRAGIRSGRPRMYCSEICRRARNAATRRMSRGGGTNETAKAIKPSAHWKAHTPEQIARRRNTESLRTIRRQGITPAEYNKILQDQNYACAICGTERSSRQQDRRFQIDHDHDSGRIRGLLCHTCNMGIGFFGEDVHRLKAAIAYIERWAVIGDG